MRIYGLIIDKGHGHKLNMENILQHIFLTDKGFNAQNEDHSMGRAKVSRVVHYRFPEEVGKSIIIMTAKQQ